MKVSHLFLLILVPTFFAGCNSESQSSATQSTAAAPPPAAQPTPGLAPPYVIKDSSAVQLLESGVQLYVIEAGNGAIPDISNNVFIHYHGMLTDGTVFDSSFDRGTPADFALSQLIRGWQIGLTRVKTGAKIKLIVPPEVGYGAQGTPNIPPNSTLIFDIELISTY